MIDFDAKERRLRRTLQAVAERVPVAPDDEALLSRLTVPTPRRPRRLLTGAIAAMVIVAGVGVALAYGPRSSDVGGTSKGSTAASSPTSTTSSPTSTTAETEIVSLSVVSCRTTFAIATQPSTVPLPSLVTVTVPRSAAQMLTVYVDTSDITALLGPKGWNCVATYGADGSGGIALYAPGEIVPSSSSEPGPLYPSSSEKAITGFETGGSPVQAAGQACPYFPMAAATTQTDLGHGCSAPPSAETVSQISSNVVGYEDPPGVKGGGNPSGGPYPAIGVVTYSATIQPGTYVGNCTLPQRQHDVCTAVLNYFASLYGGTRPGVPRAFP
jgi:hypothetical protein